MSEFVVCSSSKDPEDPKKGKGKIARMVPSVGIRAMQPTNAEKKVCRRRIYEKLWYGTSYRRRCLPPVAAACLPASLHTGGVCLPSMTTN